jgi:hypothetical protein
LGAHATIVAHATQILTSGTWSVSRARIPNVPLQATKTSMPSFGNPAYSPGGNQGSGSSTANLPPASGANLRVTPAEAKQSTTITASVTASTSPPIIPSSSSLAPPSAWSRPPTEPCWLSADCNATLTEMTYCYDVSGNLTEPNGRDGDGHSRQSETYQACLCDGRMYREYAVALTCTPFVYH